MPDLITYQIMKGVLSAEMQEAIAALYERAFATKQDRVGSKLHRKDLVTITAEADDQLIGFKIGYGYDEIPDRFYSWLGGVHPDYRSRGIGNELMRRQHTYCRAAGYRAIRTKTTNQWRNMLLLNIRHGFRIIGTYLDDRGEVKIMLEKLLID